jgi:hypothetical protein
MVASIHDKDLLSRLGQFLDPEGSDDDSVLALEFLTDSCGCSMEDATRVVIQLLIQTATAKPEALRLVAQDIGIELPLLPFFES